MLDTQGDAHVTAVHQHVGQTRQRPGNGWAQRMIGLSFEGLCDVDGRGTRSTASQRVDPAVEVAVANATDQEPTEAVLEVADKMRSNRFHIPTGTQTRCGQLFGIEAVKKSGD